MKETSLSRRLIIVFSSLFMAMLIISSAFAYQSAKLRINKDYDAQLISEAHLLWMIASEEEEETKGLEQIDLDFGAPSMNEQQRSVLSQYTQWRAFRIWKDGKLVEQSDTSKVFNAPPAASGFSEYKEGKDVWRCYAVHAPESGLIIEAWEKLDNRNRLIFGIIDELIEPAFVLLPIFALLLVLSVRYGLKDLLLMAQHIRNRNPDDLSSLEFEKIPKELRPLKKSLNALLGKLQTTIEREHQFIDNAAHELKTPLAVLKLQSQLIQEAPTEKDRDECIQVLQQGVDRTRIVFDQILMLSRISDRDFIFENRALNMILRKVIADRASIAANKNIEMSLEGEDFVVETNPDLLEILLGILIDNALKYTPEGGEVIVRVFDHRIEVTDTGPGIVSSERDKVFERFYRIKGDDTQGSGLGLAIAQRCAEILKIKIELVDPAGHAGLKVIVNFLQNSPNT